ncbi:condensation domain-containing protein [Pseudomonas aeruginosa]|uniref:condensation domain-containing protein n=1 Tax=Pseudomonas aeruginosa TaxID=287 RepID=UPI003D2D3B01
MPAGEIEDVYPLTPMQEGLLLHTLLEPGTGIYYMQDRYRIDSPLDPERFAAAWQAVVARHEALRASFVWNAGETMLQVIHKPGRTRIEFLDWSELPEDGHEERLQALHKREREAGFDLLEQPPLPPAPDPPGRGALLVHDEQPPHPHRCLVPWPADEPTSSRSTVLSAKAARRTCRRRRATATTSPGCNARTWSIATLVEREPARLRAADPGAQRPPVPPRARRRERRMIVGDRYTRLDAADGARLRELAQRYQLTVNTFAQAAWALTLRRFSGERDVLFGVTVAGRPVGMPEMQRTVGLFINSIPLRVQMPAAGQRCTVREWLNRLFERNLELREHEHLPLVAIQESSELPKGQPLFDSLFVFENAPVEVSVLDRAQSLNASSDSGRTHTNFPLTVVCYPGDDLGLHLSYDQRYSRRRPSSACSASSSACCWPWPTVSTANWRPCRCSARTSATSSSTAATAAPATTRWSKATCGCSRRRWRPIRSASPPVAWNSAELRRAEPPGQPPRPRPARRRRPASTSRWHCWPSAASTCSA